MSHRLKPKFSLPPFCHAARAPQAAGPQHSWFHHLSNSLRRPATPGRGERDWVTDADRLTDAAPTVAAGGGGDVVVGGVGGGGGASRRRIATIDAGDPNHRSPVSCRCNDGDPFVLEEEVTEAPVATVASTSAAAAAAAAAVETAKKGHEPGGAATGGDGAAGDEEGKGRNGAAHGRIIRLGPLVLPVCFFGGGGRA